jgi:hypothetical protein
MKGYPVSYVPEEKHIFKYADGKLIKKEYHYYLTDYLVYYLGYYESYEYNADGQLTQVIYYNNSHTIFWKYTLSYPSENSIRWNRIYLLDGGWGDQEETVVSSLYTRTGDNYTMNITEFPGQPSQTELFFDGYFNLSNNMTGKTNYYEGAPYSKLTAATYDDMKNPLKSHHEFFKRETPTYLSISNPIKLRYDATDNSSFYQLDYTYEYNALNYPVTCYQTQTDHIN